MAQRLGTLVRRFLLSAKHHHHAACGVEFDDHVRALIRDPEVVVLVHLHRVRERPGIQVVSDLAKEFSVDGEL
jgi:hypothetical protein